MQISYCSCSNFRARPRRQHQSRCLTRFQTSPRPSQQSDLLKIWQDIFKECMSAIKAQHWLFAKARLLGYAPAGGVYAWIWCWARGRQRIGDCDLLNAAEMFTVFTSSRADCKQNRTKRSYISTAYLFAVATSSRSDTTSQPKGMILSSVSLALWQRWIKTK